MGFCKIINRDTNGGCPEYNIGGVSNLWLIDLDIFEKYHFDLREFDDTIDYIIYQGKEIETPINPDSLDFKITLSNKIYNYVLNFVVDSNIENLDLAKRAKSNRYVVIARCKNGLYYTFGDKGGQKLSYSVVSGDEGSGQTIEGVITYESTRPVYTMRHYMDGKYRFEIPIDNFYPYEWTVGLLQKFPYDWTAGLENFLPYDWTAALIDDFPYDWFVNLENILPYDWNVTLQNDLPCGFEIPINNNFPYGWTVELDENPPYEWTVELTHDYPFGWSVELVNSFPSGWSIQPIDPNFPWSWSVEKLDDLPWIWQVDLINELPYGFQINIDNN